MAEAEKKDFLSRLAKKGHSVQIALIVYIALFAAFLVISFAVLKVPVIPVCTIAVLETVLLALLRRSPFALHIVVIAGQIVCGFAAGKGAFMILMAAIYAAGLVFLIFWKRASHR